MEEKLILLFFLNSLLLGYFEDCKMGKEADHAELQICFFMWRTKKRCSHQKTL